MGDVEVRLTLPRYNSSTCAPKRGSALTRHVEKLDSLFVAMQITACILFHIVFARPLTQGMSALGQHSANANFFCSGRFLFSSYEPFMHSGMFLLKSSRPTGLATLEVVKDKKKFARLYFDCFIVFLGPGP